jgi:hypothetical protein
MATIDLIGSSPTFRALLTEVARVAPLVDREAVKLLAFSEFNGLELRNCLAYIREWITRESPVQAGRVAAGDASKGGYRRCLMQMASTIIGMPV